MKLVLAAVAATVVAATALTVWIGARVREDTVVKDPYEAGLRWDAEHGHGGAAVPPSPRPSPPARAGGEGEIPSAPAQRPLSRTGAAVPPSPRPSPPARAGGEGEIPSARADHPLSLPGDRPLSRTGGDGEIPGDRSLSPTGGEGQGEGAASRKPRPAPCDLSTSPCTLAAGALTVTLELSPRPARTMAHLHVAADVREGGQPVEGAAVTVSFAMRGMYMGENRVALVPAGGGAYVGKALLVRCPSGRADWTAEVTVRRPGAAPASRAFDLRVAE